MPGPVAVWPTWHLTGAGPAVSEPVAQPHPVAWAALSRGHKSEFLAGPEEESPGPGARDGREGQGPPVPRALCSRRACAGHTRTGVGTRAAAGPPGTPGPKGRRAGGGRRGHSPDGGEGDTSRLSADSFRRKRNLLHRGRPCPVQGVAGPGKPGPGSSDRMARATSWGRLLPSLCARAGSRQDRVQLWCACVRRVHTHSVCARVGHGRVCVFACGPSAPCRPRPERRTTAQAGVSGREGREAPNRTAAAPSPPAPA